HRLFPIDLSWPSLQFAMLPKLCRLDNRRRFRGRNPFVPLLQNPSNRKEKRSKTQVTCRKASAKRFIPFNSTVSYRPAVSKIQRVFYISVQETAKKFLKSDPSSWLKERLNMELLTFGYLPYKIKRHKRKQKTRKNQKMIQK